jgi:hypothetical protein
LSKAVSQGIIHGELPGLHPLTVLFVTELIVDERPEFYSLLFGLNQAWTFVLQATLGS